MLKDERDYKVRGLGQTVVGASTTIQGFRLHAGA